MPRLRMLDLSGVTPKSATDLAKGGFMSMKEAIDKGLNKLISRKLLSWVTASAFLCLGLVNSEQWTAITIGYVGIQGFADLASTWKHGK